MNFDSCNYVINNAGQLIRSILNQGQQTSTNSETGYTTNTDTLMGRQPTSSSGNFMEAILIIVGMLFIYSLLNNFINNRRNKLNQKPRPNHEDKNNDKDTSSVM